MKVDTELQLTIEAILRAGADPTTEERHMGMQKISVFNLVV